MATYYVSTGGSSSNSGTSTASPWDMQTAMNGSGLTGGDTVLVRGGTYGGAYVCYVKGSSDTSRVTFKPYGTEKVYFNKPSSAGASIALQGCQYVDFWNFEFYCSSTNHAYDGAVTHTGRAIYRNSSTTNTGVRVINCVLRDLEGGAVSPFQETKNLTLYGCLMFFCGVNSHDHTAYTKNVSPSVDRYEQCIMHNSAGHNVHGYSSTDDIHNIQVVDCTIFQAGAIGRRYSDGTQPGLRQRNVLFGPDSGWPARSCLLQGSDLYFVEDGSDYGAANGDNIRLGYGYGAENTTIKNNYVMRSQFTQSGTLTNCTITGNTFWCYPVGISPSTWPNNTWLDYSSVAGKPSGTKVFVRKNKYDSNRGNVSIYNWSAGNTATINNSDLVAAGFNLASGDTYELWNVQAWGNDIISGTYNGTSISVDMRSSVRKLNMPIGYDVAPVTTFPEFGAFVLFVTSSGGGGGTGPITVTPSPAYCRTSTVAPGLTITPNPAQLVTKRAGGYLLINLGGGSLATIKYATPNTIESVMTTELNSIANAATALSANVSNNAAGELYLYADFELNLAAQGVARSAGAYVAMYFELTLDGTNYSFGSPSVWVANFAFDATLNAQRVIIQGVRLPPQDFKILLDNETGQALAATSNTLKMIRYNLQSV